MATKDDRVHLIDEASYSGNFKEKSRYSTLTLSYLSPHFYSNAQTATWSKKGGNDYGAVSPMGTFQY